MISFCTAGPEHLPAIEAIERACFLDPWPTSAFLSELEHDWSWFQVALVGEGAEPPPVRGYVICWIIPQDMHLLNLAVHPAWRRRGIGSALLGQAVDFFAGRGGGTVYLEVRQSNREAQQVYHRLGFTPVGRRPGYYRRLREDALVMAMRVPGRAVPATPRRRQPGESRWS
ncbi:MAG: ribosomal-protein-alanine N-acetyltransferase [Deltaproteobacteria bacterium]|nr:MAG: ribosomal-protein-alanine N-acetyltransferase [Deltaproteobacteria bacterium]